MRGKAFVVGVMTLLAAGACRFGPSAEEQTELAMIRSVAVAGFERVGTAAVNHGMRGVFVGTADGDLRSRISGGGLVLYDTRYGTVAEPLEALYDGTGIAPDGTECYVRFDRLRAGAEPPDAWDLPGRHRRAVTSGGKSGLAMWASCGIE